MPKTTAMFLTFLIATVSAFAAGGDAQDGGGKIGSPYGFGSASCSTHGAWTNIALEQARSITSVIDELGKDGNCNALVNVIRSFSSQSTTAIEVPGAGDKREEEDIETTPMQIRATSMMLPPPNSSVPPNKDLSTLLGFQELKAAAYGVNENWLEGGMSGSSGSDNIFNIIPNKTAQKIYRYAEPTRLGLGLATNLMNALPSSELCLMGHPSAAAQILSVSVSLASAYSSSGSAVSKINPLGDAIANMALMWRNRKFALAMRKQMSREFWNSISCLIESTTQNYCEAANAQGLLQYYEEIHDKNEELVKNGSKDINDPLAGYYMMVRELPKIETWLQKVIFGADPVLMTDAEFKATVWQEVTAYNVAVNRIKGAISELSLFVKEQTTAEGKRNAIYDVLTKIIDQMGQPGAIKFFNASMNSVALQFYIIGMDTIPPECYNRTPPMDPMIWMKTGGINGNGHYAYPFNDPDQLLRTMKQRSDLIIASANLKASEYFRNRLVVDTPNLVMDTLSDNFMTTHEAFEHINNYLESFKKRLSDSDSDADIYGLVEETQLKITKFLNSYNELTELGRGLKNGSIPIEALSQSDQSSAAGSPVAPLISLTRPLPAAGVANNTGAHGGAARPPVVLPATAVIAKLPELPRLMQAAKRVITVAFDEFNMMLQRSSFLTNRMQTIIRKDFAMRINAQVNLSDQNQKLLILAREQMIEKLVNVNGVNPASSKVDLSIAQTINKASIGSLEEVFQDPIYEMIAQTKNNSTGGSLQDLKKSIQKKKDEEKGWFSKALDWVPGGTLFTTPAAWNPISLFMPSSHPDLDPSGAAKSFIAGGDDVSNSFEQVQAVYCIQTLAFENREYYRDICHGAILRSAYKGLDIKYDDYLNMFQDTVARIDALADRSKKEPKPPTSRPAPAPTTLAGSFPALHGVPGENGTGAAYQQLQYMRDSLKTDYGSQESTLSLSERDKLKRLVNLRSICAYNNFLIKNYVHYLLDQYRTAMNTLTDQGTTHYTPPSADDNNALDPRSGAVNPGAAVNSARPAAGGHH